MRGPLFLMGYFYWQAILVYLKNLQLLQSMFISLKYITVHIFKTGAGELKGAPSEEDP